MILRHIILLCLTASGLTNMEKTVEKKKILITGGTSGLGLQLVKIFLDAGYHVVATGRRETTFPGYEERFTFCRTDFSDMKSTAEVIRRISSIHEFDVVINNAGILSPRKRIVTKDNLEYTFQVNFLAHLLVNLLVIRNIPTDKKLRVVSVVSPVYRLSRLDIEGETPYSAIRAYSRSKLYMAMMCRHLCDLFPGISLQCFGFDPGVFGSGIYRMRGSFFSFLYGVASPFMRKSSRVARNLAQLILDEEFFSGIIIDTRKRIRQVPEFKKETEELFWNECHALISDYLP